MRKYRVVLNGANFLLQIGDSPERHGFYTTRYLEAENPEAAELVALELVRTDEKLRGSTMNERTDSPMIYLDEIVLSFASQMVWAARDIWLTGVGACTTSSSELPYK
jgi:hypothetical protein